MVKRKPLLVVLDPDDPVKGVVPLDEWRHRHRTPGLSTLDAIGPTRDTVDELKAEQRQHGKIKRSSMVRAHAIEAEAKKFLEIPSDLESITVEHLREGLTTSPIQTNKNAMLLRPHANNTGHTQKLYDKAAPNSATTPLPSPSQRTAAPASARSDDT